MAFSKVLLDRQALPGGRIKEVYSWDGTGVSSSGNIAPDTADDKNLGVIDIIDNVSVSDDTSTNAAKWEYTSSARQGVTLTFTSGDVGHLIIEGKSKGIVA